MSVTEVSFDEKSILEVERSWFQMVWDLYLHRDHKEHIPPYGSVAEDFSQAHPNLDLQAWHQRVQFKLDSIHQIMNEFDQSYHELKALTVALKPASQKEIDRLIDLADRIDGVWSFSDLSREYVSRMSSGGMTGAFSLMRIVQDFIKAGREFIEIQQGVVTAMLRQAEKEKTAKVPWKLNLELI